MTLREACSVGHMGTKGQRAAVAAARELSAAGDPAAARAWTAVVAANPVHGGLWLELARAREAGGDLTGALEAYREALALGVWPPPQPSPEGAEAVLPAQLCYAAARCHARLDNPEAALSWLHDAVRRGLRDVGRLRTDEAFAGLRDDPRFPAADHSGLSQADGRRADIALLVAEMRRRSAQLTGHGPDRLGADFEEAVADLAAAVEEIDAVQFAVGCWSLLRHLGDGHAYLDAAAAHPEWEALIPNFVGETIPFTLPHSGLTANVSDLYWQSSWPLDHRTAIAPDLYAPPTYAAYAAGRDPAMDAIRADLG
jgi:tetratricopeptide (TPR) repeat protein